MSRPALPKEHQNPHILGLAKGSVPPVKYQILNCQGSDILVGRMKVTTPNNGHAFILRRYDTGAVSVTTMFRAAYPNAPEESEKQEIQWIKENYSLAGNNGSTAEPHITRLAGTWVNVETAEKLSADYRLAEIIRVVAASEPDPSNNYRRSNRANQNGTTSPPAAKAVSKAQSPDTRASKRRRPSTPPRSVVVEKEQTATRSGATKPPSQGPRRSTRAKSPVVKPTSSITSVTSPVKAETSTSPAKTAIPSLAKTPRSRRKQPTTPNSDRTIVEETEGALSVATAELHKQDVEDQRDLIAKLKAQRSVVEDDAMEDDDDDEPKGEKRAREDDEYRFNFQKQPSPEPENRVIATNRRVSMFQMEPQRKSAAWGVAAFMFGAGIMAFAPNFL